MKALVAVFAMSLAVLTAIAGDPAKYVPVLIGEKKVFQEVGQADRNRDCSVFLRSGKIEADRIGPEGMIVIRGGICIVTGTLFAMGDGLLVLDTYFDSDRKHARRRSIIREDIDYIIFKSK